MIARNPEELPSLFAAAFNDGDPSGCYEPGAQPAELAGHLALTQEMTVVTRKVVTRGDLALLIVDWRIGDVTGMATDVARRGSDGGWRYAIDNPFGVEA
ncbi:YybH family protein [Actinosynnema sp. NPDC053489]|uniref:YybH family protein n=1 Tax=Actinosynnema sp. NPDC053489 TaxID=3363916 RepID=UPI0037C9F8C3